MHAVDKQYLLLQVDAQPFFRLILPLFQVKADLYTYSRKQQAQQPVKARVDMAE